MRKVKYLHVIILTILISIQGSLLNAQVGRFKKTFHFYSTNQTEAFLYELEQFSSVKGIQFQKSPDYLDEEGLQIFDKYEADSKPYIIFFKYILAEDQPANRSHKKTFIRTYYSGDMSNYQIESSSKYIKELGEKFRYHANKNNVVLKEKNVEVRTDNVSV